MSSGENGQSKSAPTFPDQAMYDTVQRLFEENGSLLHRIRAHQNAGSSGDLERSSSLIQTLNKNILQIVGTYEAISEQYIAFMQQHVPKATIPAGS
ncbi:hypothetical protein ACKKBG_A18625 [Auxenochlorella protothecoides x Auxenochlorella symbiontica]|uniref:Protein EARLY FLOWERING 4 domain-containing protein n=2 Tax=Auxenochlorella protothecoides TaxID=3075 RepID=A0A087SCA4_AUXPR|nr:hypothetical protein F751_1054 [Auxenochlorella protothecoides]KFM23358.1 hypothetical protein F751_1054 [Auxenochlorella protothecoides]